MPVDVYSGRQVAVLPGELMLGGGAIIRDTLIAFETWGELSQDKDNAVLICHALSGDSHVAADPTDSQDVGWWGDVVGPGKTIDTDRYFVICSNVLGGCSGSTGPSALNPHTGERYALDFPIVTIEDMVDAQAALLDVLGVDRLAAVVGGSLGGMQALAWAFRYPDRVRSCVASATTWRISAQSIGFNEVGRRAILSDPLFQGGRYATEAPPAHGLSIARMIGHITYLSDASMSEKFGRRLRREDPSMDLEADFEVESYLAYQGRKFVDRFDANTYLYLTKAMDRFSLADDRESLSSIFSSSPVRFLLLAFSSDWLFPTYQTRELADSLAAAGVEVTFAEIDSTYGHDAFLLEVDAQRAYIEPFLSALHVREEVAR